MLPRLRCGPHTVLAGPMEQTACHSHPSLALICPYSHPSPCVEEGQPVCPELLTEAAGADAWELGPRSSDSGGRDTWATQTPDPLGPTPTRDDHRSKVLAIAAERRMLFTTCNDLRIEFTGSPAVSQR